MPGNGHALADLQKKNNAFLYTHELADLKNALRHRCISWFTTNLCQNDHVLAVSQQVCIEIPMFEPIYKKYANPNSTQVLENKLEISTVYTFSVCFSNIFAVFCSQETNE